MMGDKDLIGWIQAKNEELTAKAQVEDVLGAVISELRSEPQYSSVDYETITQMVRQVDLSSYDSRRMDRARDQVKEQNLPASLIPDIEYKLKEYRSLKGLFGQQGFIDMLAQQLYEQHYNARAALVRAVLNGDEDEAKDICAETPSLPEALADEVKAIVEDCRQKRREVWEKGGLHVIGTERHESRRIDDQLRGRAGRQGDPGSSHFFLSMEDELMMRFGGPRTQRILERLNIPEDTPISANVLSNVIEQSQNRFEGYYFDIRKNLVEYDEAVNRQRNIVYEERRSILEGDGTDLDTMVQQFIRDTLQDLVQRLAYGYEEWAQGEIESAIGDFSSVDTGEVNARAVVQRVLSLFPRPPQDELDDLLTVNEADVLSEALMEYVRMGLDEDHNLRMLHGEISRLMPLWPVLPPFKQRGTENWEGFSTQVLAAFDHYAQHMPQAARAEARTDLEASLERAFREQVAAINQGENLNEVKTTLEKALTTVLNDAMQAAIVETEPDLMIDILLERVNYLLDVARLPREGDIAADVWPLDRQAFAIGEDE
ncbi:MAG: hypothetical protein GYB64_17345, partial [Chloroflexi bacterium]|nr:hypothetical protein [Chloroflexota bacterium]